MPPNVFNAHRCNICFALDLKSVGTFLCSGCRLVSYCGKEHQKLDWGIHSVFCKGIKHIMISKGLNHVLEVNGPIRNKTDLEKTATSINCLLIILFNRALEQYEREFIRFPRICNFCFSYNKKLSVCNKCGAVAYCSIDHKEKDAKEHSKYCYHFKLYYDFFEYDDYIMSLEFKPKTYVTFPSNLFELLGKTIKTEVIIPNPYVPQNLEDYQLFNSVCKYSCVATILFGISALSMTDYCGDSIRIYIVGAAENEHVSFQQNHCRFLLSQLPTVESVELYFIGPQISDITPAKYEYRGITPARKIELNYYKESLEQFSEKQKLNTNSNDVRLPPNLIVCFNCGFAEFAGCENNTWKAGMEAIISYNRTPVLFTSYTLLEARCDLKEFMIYASNLNVYNYASLVNCEENPFKDSRPLRNWEMEEEAYIYFRNGFVNIVTQ